MISRLILCFYSLNLILYISWIDRSLFYPSVVEALYTGLLALFAIYIGLDITIILQKSFTLPKGQNEKIKVKKYILIGVCLVSVWLVLYRYANEMNFEKIQQHTAFFIVGIFSSVLSTRKINKIAENKDGA